MTHNKYLTLLFYLDNDSISAKSATQILPVNLAYASLLLEFLIIGLCNSSTSSPFALTPNPVFSSKHS